MSRGAREIGKQGGEGNEPRVGLFLSLAMMCLVAMD